MADEKPDRTCKNPTCNCKVEEEPIIVAPIAKARAM